MTRHQTDKKVSTLTINCVVLCEAITQESYIYSYSEGSIELESLLSTDYPVDYALLSLQKKFTFLFPSWRFHLISRSFSLTVKCVCVLYQDYWHRSMSTSCMLDSRNESPASFFSLFSPSVLVSSFTEEDPLILPSPPEIPLTNVHSHSLLKLCKKGNKKEGERNILK